jgi:fumarate hydratase subunit alpha
MENNQRFFSNKTCMFFPCHDLTDDNQLNCLFCYCPLYPLGENCGGFFTWARHENIKVKLCANCTFPHRAENYDAIMDKLTPENLTFPRIVAAEDLTPVVARLCMRANIHLPDDIKNALENYRAKEDSPVAKNILDKIIENYKLAEERDMPICQDTGLVCVFLEIGENVHIQGCIQTAVDKGVRKGYREGYFRNSVIHAPLFNRANTGDNTPAMLYLDHVPGDKIKITVVPKGFGSENKSRVKMLTPSDGLEGVVDFVLKTVKEAGPDPCPPIVVGIGLGGTMDKAAFLAKKALLRPLGQPSNDPDFAKLEATLLEKINALGIGPQGFGGRTTALGVAVEYTATHIAGLPCAVNLNCHAARHATEVL